MPVLFAGALATLQQLSGINAILIDATYIIHSTPEVTALLPS